MRTSFRVAALGAILTSAAVPARAVEERDPGVRIVWFDPLNALPDGFEAIGASVRDVFASVGVEVEWTRGNADSVVDGRDVQVILLDDARTAARGGDTMGLVEPDAPTRVAWILLPKVKRGLGLDPTPRRAMPPGDARALVSALGRVVAHEVIHAVAPGVPHARRGLMAPTLGRAALVKPLVGLDAASRLAFLDALRGVPRRADAAGAR